MTKDEKIARCTRELLMSRQSLLDAPFIVLSHIVQLHLIQLILKQRKESGEVFCFAKAKNGESDSRRTARLAKDSAVKTQACTRLLRACWPQSMASCCS